MESANVEHLAGQGRMRGDPMTRLPRLELCWRALSLKCISLILGGPSKDIIIKLEGRTAKLGNCHFLHCRILRSPLSSMQTGLVAVQQKARK